MNRRDLLVQIASVAAAAGSVSQAEAQHVHNAVQDQAAMPAGGKPKAFNELETKTLRALCELIVPGAAKGNAFEYIDLLASNNAELRTIYTGGLAWLDRFTEKRTGGARFADAKADEQTAVLDLIAFRENARTKPELGPGIRFFDWARKMTLDAYYTSAAGIKELDYKGNGAMSQFKVPQEALEYALKRSGLA